MYSKGIESLSGEAPAQGHICSVCITSAPFCARARLQKSLHVDFCSRAKKVDNVWGGKWEGPKPFPSLFQKPSQKIKSEMIELPPARGQLFVGCLAWQKLVYF